MLPYYTYKHLLSLLKQDGCVVSNNIILHYPVTTETRWLCSKQYCYPSLLSHYILKQDGCVVSNNVILHFCLIAETRRLCSKQYCYPSPPLITETRWLCSKQ